VTREHLEDISRDDLIELVLDSHATLDATRSRLDEVEQQLRWFKKQLFGQ
jgi:hypothetical protein